LNATQEGKLRKAY